MQQDIPRSIFFYFNRVKQSWQFVVLLTSNIFRSFNYSFYKKDKILTIENNHNFSYTFSFIVDTAKYFNNYGFIFTSYKGDVLIMADKVDMRKKDIN